MLAERSHPIFTRNNTGISGHGKPQAIAEETIQDGSRREEGLFLPHRLGVT